MKNISAGLFTSVDGVVGDPPNWHFPYFCDELEAAVGEQVGAASTLLLGRVTYESFAAFWPGHEEAGGADAPVAKALGDVRKVVVSRTPLTFTWRNSEQLQGDLIPSVTALKKEPGEGTIAISGSVSLIRPLLAEKLIDELHLFVHPVAVRKGERLFEDSDSPLPLTLLDCVPFKSGTVHLVYGPGDGPVLGTQPISPSLA